MSSFTYIIAISDVYTFKKTIAAVLPTLTSVSCENDTNNCTLSFSTVLTSGNLTTLQNTIATYNNPTNIEYVPDLKTISRTQTYGTSYTRVYSWQYQGTKFRNLAKIIILSRLEPQVPSDIGSGSFFYYIRFVNIDTNTVLGTGTFNNYADAYNTITLSGNSTDECTIELQIKKNSPGLYVEINNVTFYTRSF